jgi:hypothetical protein
MFDVRCSITALKLPKAILMLEFCKVKMGVLSLLIINIMPIFEKGYKGLGGKSTFLINIGQKVNPNQPQNRDVNLTTNSEMYAN